LAQILREVRSVKLMLCGDKDVVDIEPEHDAATASPTTPVTPAAPSVVVGEVEVPTVDHRCVTWCNCQFDCIVGDADFVCAHSSLNKLSSSGALSSPVSTLASGSKVGLSASTGSLTPPATKTALASAMQSSSLTSSGTLPASTAPSLATTPSVAHPRLLVRTAQQRALSDAPPPVVKVRVCCYACV
jgi:hypothetical protein